MSGIGIDEILKRAIDDGILPADTSLPVHERRPWQVVALTAAGAWLTALPLLFGLGALLYDQMKNTFMYAVGAPLLIGAVAVLRARPRSLFAEQLAVSALAAGGLALAFGLSHDLPDMLAYSLLSAVAIAIACMIPQAWLRVLIGAAAALFVLEGLRRAEWFVFGSHFLPRRWFAQHCALAVWIGAMWYQRHRLMGGAHARLAALIESLGAGWILALLAALAASSGMTLLLGAGLGRMGQGSALITLSQLPLWPSLLAHAVSPLLAAAGCIVLARRWPALCQPWCAGVAAVLALLCLCMPALGGVLIVAALCASSGRPLLAVAAGVAAAWIVGAFYYQLTLPLARKALLLAAAGLVFGLIAWSAMGGAFLREQRAATATPTRRRSPAAAWIGLCAALVLAGVNGAIWQKENLIAHGRPVFVKLAPVDPRSLMQGDYMALRFDLDGVAGLSSDSLLTGARRLAVMRRDDRGVAKPLRMSDGARLQADELLLELIPKDGRWIIVTDAWYFEEGKGGRVSGARYGELRVSPDGRALLVGLRDAALKPL